MRTRSIWAIGAGITFVIVVTTVVDMLMHAVGVYPAGQPLSHGLALLASSYRFVITVAGAWLTARLAPDMPMTHAIRLGYVGTLLALVGVAATWNAGLGPRWYPISLAALAIPQCWLGGKLYAMWPRR